MSGVREGGTGILPVIESGGVGPEKSWLVGNDEVLIYSLRRSTILIAASAVLAVVIACRFIDFETHRPREEKLPWNLTQLGGASLLYAQDHAGMMPPDINTLGQLGLLHPDVARYLSREVLYLTAGRDRASLAPNTILAVSKTPVSRDYRSAALYRSALLADGSVVAVEEAVASQPVWKSGELFVVIWDKEGKGSIEPTTRAVPSR